MAGAVTGFVTNHLAKILIGNGVLDCLAMLVPSLLDPFRDTLAPLQSKLGTSTSAVDECMRTTSHMFFLHGVVRIFVGLNVENKLARQLAAISYALELAFVLGPILSSDPIYDASKVYHVIFLTALGISLVSLYKDGKEEKTA